mgnify:CR=1 FL=1
MKTQIIEYKTFTFEELSVKSQEQALDNNKGVRKLLYHPPSIPTTFGLISKEFNRIKVFPKTMLSPSLSELPKTVRAKAPEKARATPIIFKVVMFSFKIIDGVQVHASRELSLHRKYPH